MRNNKISIDVIDNGFILYTYVWNSVTNQWDEGSVKCCQDKVVLYELLSDYFEEMVIV